MKRTAFAAAVLAAAVSAVTAGGMATADEGVARALGSSPLTGTIAPQAVLSVDRALMRRVPEQRVAGITTHVDPSCTGDGTDGTRVQVLYVRSRTASGLTSAKRAQILDELRTVDDVFAASAAKTGGGLRVRWVYGAGCVPVIGDVAVSPAALEGDFDAMHSELRAQGYDRADRKYLVFSESRRYCGMSDGNVTASVSRIDALCWPMSTTSFAAHELGHGLGAVAADAPHASGYGHCNETGDLMCNGQHGAGDRLVRTCPSWQANWFDCGNDDYFSTDPAPGSFLDSSRNIARSPYLDTVEPLPAAPRVRVTAEAAHGRGAGQVFTVRATSSSTVAGWAFPEKAGSCGLVSSANSPALRPQTGTATYACLQKTGTPASFDVQALGFNDRVGYGSAEVVVRSTPLQLKIARKPVAGRPFTVTAVAGGDPGLMYWWNRTKGCRVQQGRVPGPRATVVCSSAVAGRSVTVSVSVYRRNGEEFRASRQVAVR